MILNQNLIYDLFLKETDISRLQKILARYELFRKIIDIPGDICECGVFKGSGLFTWVKLMRLFKPNNNFNVVGFDLFGSKKRVKFKYKLDKKVQNWHKPNTINQKEIIKNVTNGVLKILNFMLETLRSHQKNTPKKILELELHYYI